MRVYFLSVFSLPFFFSFVANLRNFSSRVAFIARRVPINSDNILEPANYQPGALSYGTLHNEILIRIATLCCAIDLSSFALSRIRDAVVGRRVPRLVSRYRERTERETMSNTFEHDDNSRTYMRANFINVFYPLMYVMRARRHDWHVFWRTLARCYDREIRYNANIKELTNVSLNHSTLKSLRSDR